jgi:gamma-glutamyltranspeptidase/glutathione hydrolase
VIAKHGMAATSQPLATQAAVRILQQGGSAVDAAIAANAVLALVEPVSCGPGGDLFAIVWDAKTEEALRTERQRPVAGFPDARRSSRGSAWRRSRASVPCPSPCRGASTAGASSRNDSGACRSRRCWSPPSATRARGAPITELIAYYWKRNAALLAKYENFSATYMPQGHAPATGEVFANPALASTLEKIAQGGRAAFYEGDVARTIEAYMKRNGGYLTAADLAAHHSEWVDPVSTSYRGYDVWELPPNGQGIAALQILNILEGFDVKSLGFGSPQYVHLFVEAKKLAFEDRAKWYADPAFRRSPVAQLISKPYAAERRKLIRPERAAKSYPAGNPALEHGDTIYLTTADEEGNMVSLIQSNYRGMGSGMTPGRASGSCSRIVASCSTSTRVA